MLKSLAAAAATLFLCAAGAEIPANRRALDEATTLLSNACEIANPADVKACHGLQNTFLLNYLRAMSGEALSMKNLATYFSGANNGEVVASKMRSCAWAMMAEMSDRPPEDGSSIDGEIDLYCHNLPENDLTAAKHLSALTWAQIERQPTTLALGAYGDTWPSLDCDQFVAAAARGQFAPPRCKPQTGPLDSSVAPLVP